MCDNRLLRCGLCLLAGIVMLVTLPVSDVSGSGASPLPGVSTNEAGEFPAQETRLNDSEALRAFVDALFEQHMDEYAIPGAAFVLVKDGEVLLSKGYGVTEYGSDILVDPDQTLFDLGSIGKLFTATGVMQQVEQGTLDLDTDVNMYLSDLAIPGTYDEPITLHHLVTHTAGFDDRMFVGMVATGPDGIQPLSDNLDAHLPPRIRAPGEANQYSNAGMTLAGRLLEEASGETFGNYIENNILRPLGMERTTYDYPAELVPDMATGHEALPGPATPMETWHLNQRPAGGIRSTASDMAAFMIAHLNDGEYEGNRILDPQTVDQMHATTFRAHDGVPGTAIGFIEHQVGERRGLHHGGQWVGFSSLLYLLPDEQTGIFATYNHSAGIYAQYDLIESILDRYFPAEAPGSGTSETGAPGHVEGTYRWNRIDRHTFMQLPSMLTAHTLEVRAHDNGTISTSMSPQLIPDGVWEPIEPGVYQQVDGNNRLAIELDESGKASAVHLAWPLLMTMDRVAWHQSASLHAALLIGMLAVLLTAAAWPVTRLYRRVRGRQVDLSPDYARARLVAGLCVGFVFAFLVGTLILTAADTVLLLQVPTLFKALLWLPIIAALLTIPLVVFVIQIWRSRSTPLAGRIHVSAIAVTMLGLIPFLYIWGMLGFHY